MDYKDFHKVVLELFKLFYSLVDETLEIISTVLHFVPFFAEQWGMSY